MKVVPLPPDTLRVGRQMPFSLRDAAGNVLIARGGVIENDKQLGLLTERGLFIDACEAEAVQRAYAGHLDQMFRQDARLGQIASAKPDFSNISLPTRSTTERPTDWPDMQMRLRMLLIDPKGADWIARLKAMRDEIVNEVERNPDQALLRLFYDAGSSFRDYSANHSLLVAVLCHLARRHVPGWKPGWDDALSVAALTMNISFTGIQDELTLQAGKVSDAQRAVINTHAGRSVQLLERLGVDDPMWLHAVRHHHDAPPGPIAGRPPQELMARLIRRADSYLARLSPRKSRKASTSTAAAQGAFFDEGGHHDETGQALVKTLGLYPPGTWVKLTCGEVALVLRRSPLPKAPIVASLISRSGMPMSVPALRNTRLPDFAVAGAVATGQVNVRPNLDSLVRLA